MAHGEPVEVGGVRLPSPMMLAAGFVKGHGFSSEEAAMEAVRSGVNIIPGWRAMPPLVGPVEFGSFTRYPRLGNEGTVLWRDPATLSLQNRVGLRNPGAEAAATFLARHRKHLPKCFGINIAVSPGQNDPDTAKREVLEAIEAFSTREVYPSWYTLNVSCPNTEDDPGGRQTEAVSRDLCDAVVRLLNSDERPIPLWVKLGPDLAPEQYGVLVRVMHEVGVKAIVATNTTPMPIPDTEGQTSRITHHASPVMAGVGGGRLHDQALAAVKLLVEETKGHHYNLDIIGCGGVLDGASYHAYKAAGARAVQYWSALVYRGPLAAAVIAHEERAYDRARGRRGVARNRRGRVRAPRAHHL
jgi:dihydroorotate dehydrogenase